MLRAATKSSLRFSLREKPVRAVAAERLLCTSSLSSADRAANLAAGCGPRGRVTIAAASQSTFPLTVQSVPDLFGRSDCISSRRGFAKKSKKGKKAKQGKQQDLQLLQQPQEDLSASDSNSSVDQGHVDMNQVQGKLDGLLGRFTEELNKLRSGRPDARMLDHVKTDAYGTLTPLNEVAQISLKGAKELVINVFDPSLTNSVRDAIAASGPNLLPTESSDGSSFAVPIPKTTKESREANVKRAKDLREKTKQSLNAVRRDSLKVISKLKASKDISEDDAFALSKQVEAMAESAQQKAQSLLEAREKELIAT